MLPDTYIEFVVDGNSTYKSRSVVETETLQWMTWNVKNFIGKMSKINIVDNQRGGWGHILVDEIIQSNQEKSIYAKLLPIMLAFFCMGFVDMVGTATNYAQKDLGLYDATANIFPSMVFFLVPYFFGSYRCLNVSNRA